jgi:hypothetical protein
MKKILCIIFILFIALISCKNKNNQIPKYSFEIISDSVYKPTEEYTQSLKIWKNYFEKCMTESLFPGAFYLQLRNNISIGSINNSQEINVNKQTPILDTSNSKNIFNIFTIVKWNNCSDTLQLNEKLRTDFFSEVSNVLHQTKDNNLSTLVEAKYMTVSPKSIAIGKLIPDSVINLLNTTKDTALLHYKVLLLKPGNALLAETVELLGFDADFILHKEIPQKIKSLFSKEQFFTLNQTNDKMSIVLKQNNRIHIQINKRFAVMGGFVILKSKE